MNFRLKLLLFSIVLFSSCHNNIFYEKIDTIPQEKWSKDHILEYDFEITDSLQFYDISIIVRNTTDYKTQRLYLFFETEFPTGSKSLDTLGCIIATPSGEWTGKSKGRFKENKVILHENIRFPIKGNYKFKIQQAMRSEPLTGIAAIGLRFDTFKPVNQ
jgi:gliding motility-associated lipoprotein GldH